MTIVCTWIKKLVDETAVSNDNSSPAILTAYSPDPSSPSLSPSHLPYHLLNASILTVPLFLLSQV